MNAYQWPYFDSQLAMNDLFAHQRPAPYLSIYAKDGLRNAMYQPSTPRQEARHRQILMVYAYFDRAERLARKDGRR